MHMGINKLYGCHDVEPVRAETKLHSLARSVSSSLASEFVTDYVSAPATSWEDELHSATLSYEGEEIHPAERLNYNQVVAALPPEHMAGSIDATLLTE
eukprot:3855899-Amphidinium_carterae.1